METREDILKELKAIAPMLAGVDKTNPYRAPEGYFLNFKSVILEKVIALNMSNNEVTEELKVVAPQLAIIEKHAVADMPVNYFNDFSAQLMKKIRSSEVSTELSALAPALSIIEKANIAQVPAAYFASFPQKMNELIQAGQKSLEPEQVSWPTRLNELLDQLVSVVFKPKYTVAFAGFASILIIGIMLMVKVQQGDDLDNRLAQLSTDEINNYLDNKSDAYNDEVFEVKLDEKALPATDKMNEVHPYNDALKDIDDVTLSAAIAD